MTWNEVDREIVIHEDNTISYTKPTTEILQERMLLSAAILIVTSGLSIWLSRI